MAKFFKATNNGVTAIVSEKTYKDLKERKKLLKMCEDQGMEIPELPPITPVFTFSHESHPSIKLMTATNKTMRFLLRDHVVDGTNFYVPFSNKNEYKDKETANRELKYMTNLDDVLCHFPWLADAFILASSVD